MIPVPQRVVARGEAPVPGDCFKACVASLLELPYEAVPHFVADEWWVQPQHFDDCLPGACVEYCSIALGEVPHPSDHHSALRNWLQVQGWPLDVAACHYLRTMAEMEQLFPNHEDWTKGLNDSVLEPEPRVNHGRSRWWIAAVTSERFEGAAHAVVMKHNQVVFDPSPHPRQTPYAFVGEMWFTVRDPARCRPMAAPIART